VPRSRTQPEPPELFVDRSLGSHLLPDALRQAGFVVHTLASVYGEQEAQRVSDEDWIERAGQMDWVVLTKDDAIRRRSAEIAAVEANGVRMFCLTNARMTGEQQRQRFITNLNRIVQRARKPGPWICGVYEGQVTRIWP
jgi:hypothetical protein